MNEYIIFYASLQAYIKWRRHDFYHNINNINVIYNIIFQNLAFNHCRWELCTSYIDHLNYLAQAITNFSNYLLAALILAY